MGRQRWSLFSRASKLYLEKYELLVSYSFLVCMAQRSLISCSGEMVQVSIAPVPGKRIEHTGVKIELLGQIGMLCYPCSCFLYQFLLK
jgi:hypothetical protein